MTCTLNFAAAVFMGLSVFGKEIHPDVVKAANFAISSHNRMNNYLFAYKVEDILSHTTELYPPAWVKYSMKVQVAQTNCLNNGEMDLEDCSLCSNAQTMICDFVVLAVPGENTAPSHLLSDRCT